MLGELPPIVSNAVIGLVAVVVLLLFWRGAAGRTSADTFFNRLMLVVLLAPFVAAAVIGTIHKTPEPPTTAAPRPTTTAAAPPPKAEAPRPQAPSAQAKTPATAPATTPATAPATTPPPAAAPPRAAPEQATPRQAEAAPPSAPSITVKEAIEQLAKAPAAPSPPPAPPPAPQVATAPEPTAGATRSPTSAGVPPSATAPAAAPVAAPAAAPASALWDVVPVFYGTDRKGVTIGDRLDYSSERGRALELGGALVTVPKVHEVPNVERPWVYRLPFTQIILYQEKEDPARHFTLKEIKALSRADLVKLVRERLAVSRDFKDHAFVFVHGFNTTFEAALFRTAQIAYDLGFDGAPFLYSWPSKGQIGLQDYSYDRESSGQAEPYLRQFLEFVTRETGARSVSVIAHSMGNQLLLPVLRDMRRNAPSDVVIDQIILAAPDVDRDTFEFLAREITGVGRGITMLAASNDRALEASRRFWGGVPRAGDVPAEGPIVVPGIDTIDITATSTDILSLNHSGYAQKQQLIDDMRLLLRSGARPPPSRMPGIERVATPRGEFWRYPAPR